MSVNNSLIGINKYFDKNKIENFKNAKKCGLANIGATCYINTIIQLLGHSYPFLIMVLTKQNENLSNSLFIELQEIFKLMWIDHHSLRPIKFLKSLQSKFNFININNQQDIHEILLLILNKLNEELKVSVKYQEYKYSNEISNIIGNKCDKEWYNYHKKEYSEIIELFFGQSMNQIKCSNAKCQTLHHSYDYFSILEIAIPNKENLDLNDCIKAHFAPHYLNSDSKDKEWKCDKCDSFHKNKKVLKIWKMPPILLICLKRFEFNLNKKEMIKNDIDIKIPEELLFEKYIIAPKTNVKYKYIGSAIHLGKYNYGHYITLIKNTEDFVIIDDETIRILDKNTGNKLLEKSYILLYSII